MKKKILVVDIGGTNVKLMISPTEKRKFPSGMNNPPKKLTARIKEMASDWDYDRVSIGFPSPIAGQRIMKNPKHLAKGWVGWDFKQALGKDVRVINDAAMQALGSYEGKRMLFLGLGTGLGSTLIWERNVLPLELGDLPYPGVKRIEQVVGKVGLQKLGQKKWEREVFAIVKQLKLCFVADYVVLGGGNVKNIKRLPGGIVRGENRNAYLGGCRMWETEAGTSRPKWTVFSTA